MVVDSVEQHPGGYSEENAYGGFDEAINGSVKELARSLIEENKDSTNSFSERENTVENNTGINPVGLQSSDTEYKPELDPSSNDFSSKAWIGNLAKVVASDPDYYKPYTVGCGWRNLSALGASADVAYQTTVDNMPWKILSWLYRKARPARESDTFEILKPMDGLVKPGELLVVLGRPGSGCTTLLKSISSNTHGFKIPEDATISYSGLSPKDIINHFRGEVVYCPEADIHLPHLTVFQTLLTVARLKTPRNRIRGVSREAWARHVTEVTMATYGLSHTRNTKVGNELVRGVSGGERKRVSIAEVTICGSKFQCWDNATRGLDAATALEFVRALKTQTEIVHSAGCVAIYQCSQDAYDLFDKVCVLHGGYQIFFGPATTAKSYFERMGYYCPSRQTTADFLTSVTSPAERIINREFTEKGIAVPQTAEGMSDYWRNSPEYQELIAEVDETIGQDHEKSLEVIQESHNARQSKRARRAEPYTVSYFMQVKYLMIRNFWRIINSSSITVFQIIGNSVMALLLGSMFYKVLKKSSTGTFYYRGAAMFFAILFNAFSSLLEIFSLYEARPVTEKHKTYSLYRPSADAFASVLSEIPAKILTAVCFNIAFYFLVNFRRDAGRFFFYFLINIIAVFVMSHMYRCVGSLTKTLTEAMVPASILLLAMAMYTGFAIPKTKMLGWSKWIWWINPLSYLFESLMGNEFHDRKFPCTTFVPRGGDYDRVTGTERVCSVVGSKAGQDYVLGDDYLKESYGYLIKHKWRGFGVGMAYLIFFFFVYLFLCEVNEGAKQKGEILVFPRSIVRKMRKQNKLKEEDRDPEDVEKIAGPSGSTDKMLLKDSSESIDEENEPSALGGSQAIFHWRNLCYEVQIKGETRRILNNVDGWVKPGTLTALMGASGAGKTTLLDCLAERVTMGVITGDIFVNGKIRDESFPRSIGYCQQQDLHLKTATVRESLIFSAMLRQPKSVPVSEKKKYVDDVIRILEMEQYADAVVGVPGEGLNVEQRKRLTIGVELVAKPKLLVFLDEPTSGLDSQTAWSICQLMKKLSKHGQAILCTIHQPSAMLMQEFDRLLFLQKGGNTVYFGDLGKDCKTMIDYFESNGADPCPPDANPAEWMLEVVGAAPGTHANRDYHEAWRNSPEYQAVQQELDRLENELQSVDEEQGAEKHKSFATDVFTQIKFVSLRLQQQYWRSPQYLWSKFFLTVISELFIGFTFFKADRSMQGLQNQMLAIFMFTVIFNAILEQYLPNYVEQRDLYEARERPSRTFSWFAFIVSQILVEAPWNFLAGAIAYFIYYYPIGFYQNASAAGQLHERGALFFLWSTAFYVWVGSMALLANSFIEHDVSAANLANLCFTLALSFCGVMTTPDAMPHFWIFMYRVSPLTYFIDAVLAVGIANVDIQCSNYEFVQFTPPQGRTCGEYMQSYLKSAGTGYLKDANATAQCLLCPLSKTNDYLSQVNSHYSHRWRNYGIFICYIVFNYVAAVFLYWLARVPKKDTFFSKIFSKR
ncbi:(ZYRO0D11858g) [Zygosaccharomyces parabailii]|nr:(ZYRO0D11858g) [Zygosaccharomyces parabailii]CDH11983.1 probable Pleiotropic ABC efflux transporter of multiple drugs [Zygosaccharomyces bailii ISA1307]